MQANSGVTMRTARGRNSGFTLIELVVTLLVIIILTLVALPSFRTFQQRSALRGAADQAQSFWNQARFEAAKRNQYVTVSVYSDSGNFCLGAKTQTITSTTTADDITTCNCLTGTDCDVAVWPKTQDEWRQVSLNGTPTLGTTNVAAVIEPKRTALYFPSQAGTVSLKAPGGPRDYRLNLWIDPFGRAQLCESNGAPAHMSDFENIKCDP